MRIAICDDNETDLNAMAELFRRMAPDHSMDLFSDSAALLSAVSEGAAYHLLFLDILMPGMNGWSWPGGSVRSRRKQRSFS